LIGKCVDERSKLSAAQLRRELSSTVREIAALTEAGLSGRARTIARESSVVIGTALGELPPRPGRDAGRSTRDIINDLPR
jgi:hypothetical protein